MNIVDKSNRFISEYGIDLMRFKCWKHFLSFYRCFQYKFLDFFKSEYELK